MLLELGSTDLWTISIVKESSTGQCWSGESTNPWDFEERQWGWVWGLKATFKSVVVRGWRPGAANHSALPVRDRNGIAINKSSEVRWSLAFFTSCFYQLIPFGLSLSAFLLLFLLSSFPTSDFLSWSRHSPSQSLLWAHLPKCLPKTWSWLGHFLFKINQGLPIACRIMPKLPGKTFRGCHGLPDLEFPLSSPFYALCEYSCTMLFILAPWGVSSVTAKVRLWFTAVSLVSVTY